MQPRELSRAVSWVGAKTPTLPPATHTNSYALGTREVLLVEPATPYEDEQREWLAWARGLSTEGRRPIAIVVTHHHPDHVGGAEALARALGLPLWAHEATLARLPFVAHGGIATRTLHDGERLVLDGASPEAWEVLHTPGHAAGHVCLFDRRARVVVVGDMVASVGTILIAPGPGEGHMATYLKELARLESLEAAVALPAHGDPIDAPSALFRHYRAHRQKREDKIVAALDAAAAPEGASPEALLPIAYDDTPVTVWPIARLSLAAHLEKLVEDGRARVADGRYSRMT